MEKEAPSPSSLLQENENWGPGLFVGKEAQASFDTAYSKIGVLLLAEGVTSLALTDEEVHRQLLEACRHYWSDRDHDNRTRIVTIREEVVALNDGVDVLIAAINSLSKETRARIELKLGRSQATIAATLSNLHEELHRLRSVCLPIVQLRGTKKGSSRTSVANCCSRLINLRARLTGKPFAKTWSVKPSEANTTEAFVGDDAQFVLEMMRAIDGGVLFSNVRSAGMTLARQSAKKK